MASVVYKPISLNPFGRRPDGTLGHIDVGQNVDPNNPNAIVAPQRTTINDALKSVQASGAIPTYQDINYTPVSGVTNTLDDNYFNNIEQQATKKLQSKYFNAPDSLQAQLTNQMNKRGLIGSGIEAGNTNQLYKTFGDELVDLQSNIAQEKAKTEQDVAFKNKEIETQNATNALAADQKNRDFQGFLAQLGLGAASDEAKFASDYDTKMFEQGVNLRKNDQDLQTKLLSTLQDALGNNNIDKDTRQIFEDIFGSNMGAVLGRPGKQGSGTGNYYDDNQAGPNNATRDRIRQIDEQLKSMPATSGRGWAPNQARQKLEDERAQLVNQLLGI